MLDVARLTSLHRLADAWAAPLSAAVLVDPASNVDWSLDATSAVRAVLAELHRPQLVRATLVENTGFDCPPRFPFNVLRNIALSRCMEPRVLIIDVDFVPHPANAELPRRLSAIRLDSNEVVVLPAFEPASRWLADAPSQLEKAVSKAALRALVLRGDVVGFGDVGGSREPWAAGHQCTRARQWLNHSYEYEIQHCHPWYEPYVLLPRAATPPFDEVFAGRGWDKVSFVYELFARGSKFRVAPEAFVLHYPHSAPPIFGGATCPRTRIDEASRAMGAKDAEELDALMHNPGEACLGRFLERIRSSYGYEPQSSGHDAMRKIVRSHRHWNCEAQTSGKRRPHPRLLILS